MLSWLIGRLIQGVLLLHPTYIRNLNRLFYFLEKKRKSNLESWWSDLGAGFNRVIKQKIAFGHVTIAQNLLDWCRDNIQAFKIDERSVNCLKEMVD
jgi:hypothetical protein